MKDRNRMMGYGRERKKRRGREKKEQAETMGRRKRARSTMMMSQERGIWEGEGG